MGALAHEFGDNPAVWVIGAILLAVFVLPYPWDWPVIGIAAIVEAAETFLWIRLLRRVPVMAGPEALLGSAARVTRACHPIGEVWVRGEIWRARCDAGANTGQRVRVQAREGITLVVEPTVERHSDEPARPAESGS